MNRVATFAELIEAGILEIGDGYRAKLNELEGDGPIFLRAASVAGGRIDYDNNDRFAGALTSRLQSKIGRPGDTVVTTKGASTGRTAFVTTGAPEFVYSPHLSFWRSRDRSQLDPLFLRYWARSAELIVQLRGMAASTDMSLYLSLVDQRRLRITLPEIGVQRRVGELLGALDDKIELNRRMNETLRALIRLLFGQLLRGPTSEVSVADLAQYVNGRNFTRDASGDGRMVIRIAELNGGPGTSTVFSDAEAPDEHVARFGDILFAWSGSLGVYRWYADDALINQHIFKVVPNGYPVWFVHQHLLRALPFFRDTAADKATTMGHIKRSHLGEAKVEIPSEVALAGASEVIEPLDDRIAAYERESRTLAALRDALLPKLISGELRIHSS